MKREAPLAISSAGELALDHYEPALRKEEDLTFVSIRNYFSDVRQFMAWCNAIGTLRDQTIVVLLFHTGLRAGELCTLTRTQIHLGPRSGTIRVIGKRNKVRDVPLNATARAL